MLEDQYAQRYLDKNHLAAYMIERNPELVSHGKLVEMADALQVAYVYVFDGSREHDGVEHLAAQLQPVEHLRRLVLCVP